MVRAMGLALEFLLFNHTRSIIRLLQLAHSLGVPPFAQGAASPLRDTPLHCPETTLRSGAGANSSAPASGVAVVENQEVGHGRGRGQAQPVPKASLERVW